MQKYIALLRAINVGGHNVKMADLRQHFIDMGFSNVETFIASGNVIFDASAARLMEAKIETHLQQALGYEVSTFIRTPAELANVAACPAFKPAAIKAAAAYNVAFLKAPLSAENQRTLMQFNTAVDRFHVEGREVYWLCKIKQNESLFSNARFEKALKVKATFRGINTVVKLAATYPA